MDSPLLLGIMQGRLTPPVNGKIQAFPVDAWEREFALGREAGISLIEWIYDIDGDDVNPLGNPAGIARMTSLFRETNVVVRSVCADYFMTETLLKGSKGARRQRETKLIWLLDQCHELKIEQVVLPFVDSSRLASAEERADLIALLQRVLPHAESRNIELHLETDLPPTDFARLMEGISHPWAKINYDSGNSASHGYRPEDEFAAYGAHVGSVHIKDRVRGGGTVPLGTGHADFPALRRALRNVGYRNPFILQVARDIAGDEVAWIRHNAAFVRTWWQEEPSPS